MTSTKHDTHTITAYTQGEPKDSTVPDDAFKQDPDAHAEFLEEDNGVHQSVHGDLGIVKTILTFKWACACAFLAGLGAMSDGYQYSLPGNLLPNPGFIR